MEASRIECDNCPYIRAHFAPTDRISRPVCKSLCHLEYNAIEIGSRNHVVDQTHAFRRARIHEKFVGASVSK